MREPTKLRRDEAPEDEAEGERRRVRAERDRRGARPREIGEEELVEEELADERPALARDVARGLAETDRLQGLERYHLFHAARADLLRRLGCNGEAAAYRRALELTTSEPERRFLERRLREVAS